MNRPKRQESPGAAMRWVNQITSIGLEMAIPVGGGWWLDSKYGWFPTLTVVGAFFGAYLAIQGFRQLMKDLDQ